MEHKILKTTCARDCFGGCSLNIHIEDGEIDKVEGGHDNRATNDTICIKGMNFKD